MQTHGRDGTDDGPFGRVSAPYHGIAAAPTTRWSVALTSLSYAVDSWSVHWDNAALATIPKASLTQPDDKDGAKYH